MKVLLSALTGLVCSAAALPALSQMSIPTDMAETCTTDISGWYAGAHGPDAPVKPPSSVTFTTDYGDPSVCDFYIWGEQMFLWLTSPDGDGLVLDSNAFLNVSIEDSDGQRSFLPNADGQPLNLALRSEKLGEVGQAFSAGVLFSQQGSMVYYGVHTNTEYGYFLTGQKGGAFPEAKDFPRNAADLKALERFVAENYPGTSLPTPETLVMELKTSWVDAETVPDPSNYITIEGIVPDYPALDGAAGPCLGMTECAWDLTSTRTMTLALVGVHVVGTVQDHPEFVWATFEHVSNTPDAPFWYQPAAEKAPPRQHPYSSEGDFLFIASGAANENVNQECAKVADKKSAGTVLANDGGVACKGVIAESNTVREYPWGSYPYGPDDVGRTIDKKVVTAEQVKQIIANNTMLLSINDSVRTQLAAGDVRANYVQVGSIWTTTPSGGGDAPVPNQTGDQTAQMRGSLTLSNSTMETYTQGTTCFDCHSVYQGEPTSFGTDDQPDQLSHIFHALRPLARH